MRNLSAERRRAARAGDEGEARSGLVVSGLLHVSVITAAIFGGPIFSSDEAQAIRIAEVDLISGASFDAMISSAPAGPRGDLPSLAPPAEGPDAPSPEAPRPDATQRADPAPEAAPTRDAPVAADTSTPPPQTRPDVALARPNAPPQPDAPLAPTQGTVAEGVPLPAGADRPDAPQRDAPVPVESAPPRDIDRVAPSPTPPSPLVAQADDPVPAVSPDASAAPETPTPPDQPAAAPEAATSQIVTEADETSDRDAPAPVASALPVGRPDVIPPEAAPDTPEPETPPTEVAAAQPETAQTPPAPAQPATSAAPAPAQSTNAPLGPRLTSGEVEGVKLGIQRYWRINMLENLPNYQELVVTLQVRLGPDGRMQGQPTLVRPASAADGRWQRAVQFASRALSRAAQGGFDLPAESYGRWQLIEVTFNPSSGLQFGGGT